MATANPQKLREQLGIKPDPEMQAIYAMQILPNVTVADVRKATKRMKKVFYSR